MKIVTWWILAGLIWVIFMVLLWIIPVRAGTGVPYYPYLDHLMKQEEFDNSVAYRHYWQNWNLRQLQLQRQRQQQSRIPKKRH